MPFDLPPLTDAQVQAGARPGESWEEARLRLETTRVGLLSGPDSHFTADEVKPYRMDGHLAPAPSDDEYDLLEAFAQLSPAEQREQWGRTLATGLPFDCPTLATLVAAGQDWVACVKRLPYEDTGGRLRYMVSVPDVDWLTYCQYEGGDWARVSDGSLVGSVAHWRLAREDEQASREPTAEELRKIRGLRGRRRYWESR